MTSQHSLDVHQYGIAKYNKVIVQNAQQLAERISKLNPGSQKIVEKFVERLEANSERSQLTLDQAIDEFEREHPELLRLLAQ